VLLMVLLLVLLLVLLMVLLMVRHCVIRHYASLLSALD
jgi:hypothetical protein